MASDAIDEKFEGVFVETDSIGILAPILLPDLDPQVHFLMEGGVADILVPT